MSAAGVNPSIFSELDKKLPIVMLPIWNSASAFFRQARM
jgi:hypothetical protein